MNTILLAFFLFTTPDTSQEITPNYTILAEAQWKCRRCGHYNWSANAPYTCNNCTCSIGEC